MRIAQLLTPGAVIPRIDASSKDAAIQRLVSSMAAGRDVDVQAALRDIALRDRSGPTLLPAEPYLLALPHASTNACKQLIMAVGTSQEGIPWNASGSHRAHVVVVILAPPQSYPLYLRVLGRIARLCRQEGFVRDLLRAETPEALTSTIAAAEEPWGEITAPEGLPTFCVLGAGPGGMAMAGHLALTGCTVNLFNRSPERIAAVQARGGIDVTGKVEGFAGLNRVTTDAAEAIDNVDVLMVVVPATAHRNMAEIIAPHVKDGQILVLNPGRTGGALEVAQVLQARNPSAGLYVAEVQSLLYAARMTNPGQVHIFGIKNSVPLATLPAYEVADILPAINRVLPQFVPGDNVLKTSLDNIGAVFHPAITILNAARIEDTHCDFEYYVEGVTPAVASVLEAVDRERVAVASALGIRANTAREWLYLAYDAAGKTLLDAMRANPGYTGIKAAGTIQHRYISEDVPTSLVPIASIGEMLGVPTPTTRAIIHLGSVMHGVDYWAEGRTVDRLGISGMSVKDIRFLVVGAQPVPAAEDRASSAAAAALNGSPVGESAGVSPRPLQPDNPRAAVPVRTASEAADSPRAATGGRG
jgi:opine dehydrogenase